jgi:predicted dehydrogenase
MSTRLRLAVIGVGHLGKEHARILAGLPDVELVGVADTNADQAQAVARRVGSRAFHDYWPLLNLVDAASIVVPTVHHHAVAREFLRRGIPVLVEKPLTISVAEADNLIDLADSAGALLQVGHIERFNPAFEELNKRPMQPKFVQCERLGPFSGRSTDIGAVLDLMIHDIDLLLALVKAPVVQVEALGVSLFGKHEDVANARLTFANGCVASLTASRASAASIRRMHVWAPEGYASVDFAKRRLCLVQPSAYCRRHGLDVDRLEPAARARLKEELFGRHLEVAEIDGHSQDQLTCELKHFVDCVRTGAKPRVAGSDAHAALVVAERILDSLRSHHWEGQANGPVGPHQLPTPLGTLFQPLPHEGAA